MDEDRELETLLRHYETDRGEAFCHVGTSCVEPGELVNDWQHVNCDHCLWNRDRCQHVDFDEWMDGAMKCRDCGLESYSDVITGEPLKHCVNCGAAHDTAVLWKLRCSEQRHNYKL